MRSLGAENPRVAINTVDTEFFRIKTEEDRSKLVKDGKIHLLSIGYLAEKKNPIDLLKIMTIIKTHRNDVVLDLVGDGDERGNLENYISENQLENQVIFHGFRQKDELPKYLSGANLFLFQTGYDIWGLVLNEAMASGLPCLASQNAGSSHDLIVEGETGFMVDFSKHEKIALQILDLLNDENRLKEIGEAAGKYIQENVSLKVSASGFIREIEKL